MECIPSLTFYSPTVFSNGLFQLPQGGCGNHECNHFDVYYVLRMVLIQDHLLFLRALLKHQIRHPHRKSHPRCRSFYIITSVDLPYENAGKNDTQRNIQAITLEWLAYPLAVSKIQAALKKY